MAASHDLLQSVQGGHEHDVSAEMKKESLLGVIGSDNNLSPDLTTHVVHEHGEHLQLDAELTDVIEHSMHSPLSPSSPLSPNAEDAELPVTIRRMLNDTAMPLPVAAGKPEWTDTRVREVLNLGLGMAPGVRRADALRLSAGERLADPRLNRMVLRCVRNERVVSEKRRTLVAPTSQSGSDRGGGSDAEEEPEDEEQAVSEVEVLRQEFHSLEQELESVWEMKVVSPLSPRSPGFERRGSGRHGHRHSMRSSLRGGEEGAEGLADADELLGRYLRSRVSELEAREATVESRTRQLIHLAHRFIDADNADVTPAPPEAADAAPESPVAQQGTVTLPELALADGADAASDPRSPTSEVSPASKLAKVVQDAVKTAGAETPASVESLPPLRPRVVAFEATETMEVYPFTATSGVWVSMREAEARAKAEAQQAQAKVHVPVQSFDEIMASAVAETTAPAHLSSAAEDFLERKRQRDAAKSLGREKKGGRRHATNAEILGGGEAAVELTEKSKATNESGAGTSPLVNSGQAPQMNPGRTLKPTNESGAGTMPINESGAGEELDAPLSPASEHSARNMSIFNKIKPTKPPEKMKLPDTSRLDAMIHRAKTITTDLVEAEPPPPPTRGKKGQERLMKRPSDAIKVGADAARHTTRSKSLPEAKVTKPTGDLDLGDLDLFTRSLSVGMDPIPDDLPDEDVENHVREAFSAVLEAPVPLDATAAVQIAPRYRALSEKYDVRPNSGALAELERVHRRGPKGTKILYNFAHCLLGDRGVAPLLLALCHDRQRPLKVNLRDCGLHTVGCHIVAGFMRHPSLVQLDISDNPVSLTAGELLLAAIEERSAQPLPSVDLRLERTYVSSKGKKPVVGYPCGHRKNLRSRYSMIASTLERARSPSPDGSEKSVDSGHSSSKRTDISRISASPYDYLMFQRLKETYAPNVHELFTGASK